MAGGTLQDLGVSLRLGVRVVLYDHAGAAVAEITPQLESVVWRLNGTGSAQFRLGYHDEACQKLWLQPGCRVLIEFENGLPDWGGVIEFPLKQDTNGVVITAFSADKILDWRRIGKSLLVTNQSPGAIFQTLLENANEQAQTGISVGTIYAGGTQRTIEYHLQNLGEQVQELLRNSGHDMAVLPVVNAGVLSFVAYWYEMRGEDKSDQILLVENRNCQVGGMDWYGPIYNRITLAGEGSTWEENRVTVTEENTDSQGDYGYREYAEVQAGVVNESTLTANAKELVAAYCQPRKKLSLAALDHAPALFADYDVGDVVRVQAFLDWPEEWALDDAFRVIAREWKPEGVCNLEVVEWEL